MPFQIFLLFFEHCGVCPRLCLIIQQSRLRYLVLKLNLLQLVRDSLLQKLRRLLTFKLRNLRFSAHFYARQGAHMQPLVGRVLALFRFVFKRMFQLFYRLTSAAIQGIFTRVGINDPAIQL